ncbi:MAG: HupE/UreJ family protein [Bacteroidota bacterium]
MYTQSKTFLFSLLLLCFLSPVWNSQAHSPDQSYLYLRIYGDAMGGRVEMTAKDMNKALDLGLSDDLSMEVIQPYLPRIYEYIKSRVAIQSSEGQHEINFTETTILDLEEMEDFARFNFDLSNVSIIPEALDIDYNVLFDKDNLHKGMLIVEYNWKAGIVNNESLISNIFSPNDTRQSLSLKDASLWKGFIALVKLGIWHIWIGLDHILFIVALILPAVVRREEEGQAAISWGSSWSPVEQFRPAFIYIIKIITFFTIAHSITLALAALEVINLPSRFVESVIAISIALAAYHNIRPIFKSREWIIAFGFGLFHGFGFASVLGEKGLSGDFMILSLLGFNVGVEVGQVLIICAIFPILFLIRKNKLYPVLINYGSIILILISLYWFIERGFDVDLPLGAYFWKVYHAILG